MKKFFRKISILLTASLILSSVPVSTLGAELEESVLTEKAPDASEGSEGSEENTEKTEEENKEEEKKEEEKEPEAGLTEIEEKSEEEEKAPETEEVKEEPEAEKEPRVDENSETAENNGAAGNNEGSEGTVTAENPENAGITETTEKTEAIAVTAETAENTETAVDIAETTENTDNGAAENPGNAGTANEGTVQENTDTANEGTVQENTDAANEGTVQENTDTAADPAVNTENTDVAGNIVAAGGAAETPAVENAANETALDVKWEDETKTDSDKEDKEKEEDKDDEEEDSEDEDSEEEDVEPEESDPEDDYGFIPGNIDMNMDFSKETVRYISSATQERIYGNTEDGEASLNSLDALEESYYGSYENYVTEPKNQGKTAWCWAYAAASLAETSMIKNGILTKEDLESKPVSPKHIVQTTYNPNRYDYYGETWEKASEAADFDADTVGRARDFTGYMISTDTNSEPLSIDSTDLIYARGNLMSTVFNFERLAGPSREEVINFEGNTDIIDAQLRDAIWVPNNDIDSIKAMIRDYGSVGIQMDIGPNTVSYRESADQKDITHYFKYTPTFTGYTTNHTAVLVAWDNSIDRNLFTVSGNTPASNGAFLVKNSYAGNTALGDGYFWISYEDAAFKLYNGKYKYAVAFDFAPSKTNDFTYGYDGTNHFGSYYTKKVYGIFKSNHSGETASGKVEMLKSIGVGLQDAGKYQLTIYSGYDPSASKGNQYLTQFEVETKTVEFNYPGYHIIELDYPILFYKNDVISVSFEKYDSTNFNFLVDGYGVANPGSKEGGWNNKNSKGYFTDSDIKYEKVVTKDEDGNSHYIVYNAFTHGDRENVESYFATAGDSSNIVSGNKVPTSGQTTSYIRITPRMRLYTSNITVPKNIDQTMLDIKLKKYIWTHTGNNVCPWPEVMVDFNMTEGGRPKDRGGRYYDNGIVMYNQKKETINKVSTTTEYHYKLSYANNKEAGLAAVIVRGTGDIFSGEISTPFKIEKDQIRIEKCKILGLEPQDLKTIAPGKTLNNTYADVKNNMVIKYYVSETKHYVTLREGVDYKLGSIEGTNEYGKKLSVMVTGIGTFRNTIKPTFKIRKENKEKPLSDTSVVVKYRINGEDKVWDGRSLPEFDYSGAKVEIADVSLYEKDADGNETKLEPDVHYKSKFKYKGNKSAGMASITIKAVKGGGFTGSITRYFMIDPMHVTTDATVKFNKTYRYTGNPIKAKPTVKLYGKKMAQKDICVIYFNNTGSSSGEATATGIVFGRGRYTGYVGYSTFTIKSSSSTT